jgi:hypothetical protein
MRIFIALEINEKVDPEHAWELITAALDNGALQQSINEDCNCEACLRLRADEDDVSIVLSATEMTEGDARRALRVA